MPVNIIANIRHLKMEIMQQHGIFITKLTLNTYMEYITKIISIHIPIYLVHFATHQPKCILRIRIKLIDKAELIKLFYSHS